MGYVYESGFFDYIEEGAARSADVFIENALLWLKPYSVLDLGCGRGAWLAAWKTSGVQDIHGVDGDYVEREQLLVAETEFTAADLTRPLDLGRRFDFAQSLEVAEHLPPDAAETFVDSLCQHADIILFSAAVTGQGGENHLNERPLDYWRGLFERRGFRPFDAVRPILASRRDVEPWYRYNAVLYANHQGCARMPEQVLATRLREGQKLTEGGNFRWRARRAIVRVLPRAVVTGIARLNARAQTRRLARFSTGR